VARRRHALTTLLSALAALGLLLAEYAFVLAFAPLLVGVNRAVKARNQLREGPSVWQPYRDLARLFRKSSVYAEGTTWISVAAPWVSLGSLFAIVPFLPWFFVPGPLGFAGDLVLVVGLFALSRFFLSLAAFDAGSAFGGLGASREMWIAALAEPVFLLSIFAWGAPSGSTQASAIVQHGLATGWDHWSPALWMASAGFALLVVAETGRLPVDNPATHLELTMVHEAMVLETSGRDLALVELGHAVKLTLLLGLLVAVLLPWGTATGLDAIALGFAGALVLAKLLTSSWVVAQLESRVAKWRLFRVPDLLTLAAALGLGSVALTYLVGVGA
jgi:formate hydrogenlyase subunit 4